jgi:hypothetical protein
MSEKPVWALTGPISCPVFPTSSLVPHSMRHRNPRSGESNDLNERKQGKKGAK